ncbi:type I restriction endonuclease [Succinimonas sp.]|uniref:type I restriction endonuclease n=1 Tax=Succinimonas sp. TaxID=1936151 RepID=UPI0038695C4F
MKFNEDSRVKIPALIHFLRLGYKYQTKKNQNIDLRNNIFVDIFKKSVESINNKGYSDKDIQETIKEIADITDNSRDKGQAFFERLKAYSEKMRLINLEAPENNDWRVVSELPFKGERDNTFRPDITIIVNGIPLGFVEVKKPNNQYGIQAEFNRMNERLNKPELTHFFNQLQVLGFSNNQNYDDEAKTKRLGSFYTTPNDAKHTKFNHFREEQEIPVMDFVSEDDITTVLSDNNIMSIRHDNEFEENLCKSTPANSFITSVYSPQRFMFFIRYGIVYVDSPMDGFNKHIIRYPQYFALQCLINDLDCGTHRGVLWHTQGSGKTAFAYFATNILRDYYQKKRVITKFYFVVDRLDLLNQANTEFSARGMTIASINSKSDFVDNMQSPVVIPNDSQRGQYKETMNVVNIQKFSDDSTAIPTAHITVQRIYFLDEVHRGYKPKGTFLGNLLGADKDGIFIGLTGTPILETVTDQEGKKYRRPKRDFKTTDLFNKYIHKYYYNKSIADGYTLKIKKEAIDVKFRNDIRKMLELANGQIIPAEKWNKTLACDPFVGQLCEYIRDDFKMFEETMEDDSMGFMIVATSSEQAKKIQKWYEDNTDINTALVLHDEEGNKEKQELFRGKRNNSTGEVEIKYKGVIVFNMLLTGFDAPRLKRLYLLRTIREHNLLQTLARVNRPYKAMTYGYVVDFVDVTEEFEDTNRRYLEELRSDIGDDEDVKDVDDIFVDVEEVKGKIKDLENRLFIYMGNIENNLEAFRKQIEPLDEKSVREIDGWLVDYKGYYNELKMSHVDVSAIPIERIKMASYETARRVQLLIAEHILNHDNGGDLIDFTDLIVEFIKTGEVDLDFTSEQDVLDIIGQYTNAESSNTDKDDHVFKDIHNRYKQAIKDFKDNADTTSKVKAFLDSIKALTKEMQILNGNNTSLANLYNGSEEYMRIHKRLVESYSENLDNTKAKNIMTKTIFAIESELGHMQHPSHGVIVRSLLRPVREALVVEGFNDVSRRQVENIIYLFIDDKFSQE